MVGSHARHCYARTLCFMISLLTEPLLVQLVTKDQHMVRLSSQHSQESGQQLLVVVLAVVSREYFGTTSGGKTDMEGCCFSDIIAKIKGGNTDSSAFSLSGTKGINIKTSLVYNCGDNIASYTAIIASSEGETYVDNFNSSSNRGNGDGLGLTIYTNNNGVNSHSTLQYTNFFDIKSGTVLYATHTDLAGGKGEDLTNYKHTIDLICINFISTSGNDAMISTLNSYGKGASSLPNRVYMVSFEQCAFKQNEYRNKIDINFQYEYPECLTLNGCKGDKDTFTVDLYNFITITDTMYKKVADPKPNAVFSPVCTYNAPAPPSPKTPTPKPPPPPPPPKTPTSKPVPPPPPPPPKTPTSKPVTVQPIPPKPATSQSQIDPDDSHQNDDTKGKVMTSGKIAGIVIGVIFGVAVLGVAGLVIYKKVLKKPEDSDMGADGITI